MQLERACGVLLHPSSLPSPYGVGDLGQAAFDFIDFLAEGGQTLWQVLPLGPTGYGDSPYQSFSAFAGNTAFLSLEQLVKDGLLEENDLSSLPHLPEDKADLDGAMALKMPLLKKAFSHFTPTADYLSFCKKNAHWLPDYCLFCALKEAIFAARKDGAETEEFLDFCAQSKGLLTENQMRDYYFGAVWVSWPAPLVKREQAALAKAQGQFQETIDFLSFLQYQFHRQWQAVKTYANEKNIRIIGDIPIFVSFDSADAWANQGLFALDETGFPLEVAGVPPDYFSPTGQLWGNPVYRWKAHEADGFTWWCQRMAHLLEDADLVRLDHFRGFESNYCIPFPSETAMEGKWKKGPGRKLFSAMEKALGKLPIIAEDLGVITPQVEKLRLSCRFPGMRILQFAFDGNAQNPYLPYLYEKNCVVYTGTHDNDTSIGWYQSTNEDSRDQFRRYTNSDGSAPGWDLIRLAISSTAALAIYPLQDILCLDTSARMNTPGSLGNNWHWRYTKDQLLPSYAKDLKALATLFGR